VSYIKIITAGESHGPQLTAIVEGLPAGLSLDLDEINHQLARRQKGFGRGGRMKIESDRAQITSGLRFGKTLGSPLTITITNRDWINWTERMNIWEGQDIEPQTIPRPGHADLAGSIKYGQRDLRNILERASARETASRVAIGAVMRQLLAEFNIKVGGHVIHIGNITASNTFRDIQVQPSKKYLDTIIQIIADSEKSEVRCAEMDTSLKMMEIISNAGKLGDTVGGIFEIAAIGVPAGLGSYTSWNRRLDAEIAADIMSIPGIKSVEIGLGAETALHPGSRVHDPILSVKPPFPERSSNNAGGIEGGISNGQPLILRAAMKPIPTLTKPLLSVDILTDKKADAHKERSDVCAVPAACVVGEAMLAITLGRALIDRSGGDCLKQMKAFFNV